MWWTQRPNIRLRTARMAKKGYWYIRFSTAAQRRLSPCSGRRNAQRYARQNGPTLDSELNQRDLGVSALGATNAHGSRPRSR
jgi:hypothetical protein